MTTPRSCFTHGLCLLSISLLKVRLFLCIAALFTHGMSCGIYPPFFFLFCVKALWLSLKCNEVGWYIFFHPELRFGFFVRSSLKSHFHPRLRRVSQVFKILTSYTLIENGQSVPAFGSVCFYLSSGSPPYTSLPLFASWITSFTSHNNIAQPSFMSLVIKAHHSIQ